MLYQFIDPWVRLELFEFTTDALGIEVTLDMFSLSSGNAAADILGGGPNPSIMRIRNCFSQYIYQ